MCIIIIVRLHVYFRFSCFKCEACVSVCHCLTLTHSLLWLNSHTQGKSVVLCCCLLWSLWLCFSIEAAPLIRLHHTSLAHFATKVIIIIIISSSSGSTIIFIIKLDLNHHLTASFWQTHTHTHIPANISAQTHSGGSSLQLCGSPLKSPAPSKGKACLSVMLVIMGLSDRGRLTLSGRAECTSFRPGRSGWHRGLGHVPHVRGLASPAAISAPLCSQSH